MLYSHMFDVAFTVETEVESQENVSVQDKIKSLEKRLNYLKENLLEAEEAFGFSDTIELS